MELKGYLAIPWRCNWVILITSIVTLAITIVGALIMTPTYTASTMLRIATAPGGWASYTDYPLANRLMATYSKIATSDVVLDDLVQRLGLDEPPKVGMQILVNTEFMRPTSEHPDRKLAQQADNTTAETPIDLNKELSSRQKRPLGRFQARNWSGLSAKWTTRGEDESIRAKLPGDVAQLRAAGGELRISQKSARRPDLAGHTNPQVRDRCRSARSMNSSVTADRIRRYHWIEHAQALS